MSLPTPIPLTIPIHSLLITPNAQPTNLMHPLDKFTHCPVCGSGRFDINDEKSKCCADCGYVYYLNPSSANAAFVVNDRCELLVERRGREPQKGLLDLPGGFADIGETAEQGVIREVLEETGLTVARAEYLFSFPNTYLYSGLVVPTLDLFFRCEVTDLSSLRADDDAAEVMWIPFEQIHPDDFAFDSIRKGVEEFLKTVNR